MGIGSTNDKAKAELSGANVGMTIIDRLAAEIQPGDNSGALLYSNGSGLNDTSGVKANQEYWDKVHSAATEVGVGGPTNGFTGPDASAVWNKRGYGTDVNGQITHRNVDNLYNANDISSIANANDLGEEHP